MVAYEDAIAHYLREDVSELLWQIAQRRKLKFFHHCDTDPAQPPRARPHGVSLHGIASPEAMRRVVAEAATPVPSYPYAFFPFFGMQSSTVNAPGDRGRVIGWDMGFEFDYEWRDSFSVLFPVVATLEHFGVPVLTKFSGQRSLHVLVLAEGFPAEMKRSADHAAWMRAVDTIGELLCRMAPYLIPTHVGLSKEMILTAPYSFHRYSGLLSIPLRLREAMEFEREEASVERFRGVSWELPDPDASGEGMARLMDVAERARVEPDVVLDVAQEVFRGWEAPGDSALEVLMAGARGVTTPLAQEERVRRALVAVDHPENKTTRFGALVGRAGGFNPHSLAPFVRQRRVRCEALAAWATHGLAGAIQHLEGVAKDETHAEPVALAVRLLSFLPESPADVVGHLVERWGGRAELPLSTQLFLAIALAERAPEQPAVLEHLYTAEHSPRLDALLEALKCADAWRAEAAPKLLLAALALAFGESMLEAPEVLHGCFGGDAAKLQHAAMSV